MDLGPVVEIEESVVVAVGRGVRPLSRVKGDDGSSRGREVQSTKDETL